MTENIRALLVILLAAFIASHFVRPALAGFVSPERLLRWRNIWMLVSAMAFLSPNLWVFSILAGLYLLYQSGKEEGVAPLYLLLVCVIPPLSAAIPGFGLINYLFQIDWLRLLSLVLLLPAALRLMRDPVRVAVGRTWPDRFLLAYLFLSIALQLRDTTVTDALRQIFYAILDAFLPYYVLSRSIRSTDEFRTTLTAFVYSVCMIALVAGFEFFKHWLLYKSLSAQWEIPASSFYLDRGSSLRAVASMISPIALGYVMVAALGAFLALAPFAEEPRHHRRIWLLLAAGCFFPLSRGPWVGAVLLIVVWLATGPHALRRLFTLALAGMLSLPLLAVLPGGEKILNLLPFIGHVDEQNVSYRHELIEKAMIVIRRNPIFGSVNYLQTPEMQSMIQGQGIIDIVNTYIGVALNSGLVGLTLFCGFFASILLPLWRNQPADEAAQALRRSLLASLSAILLIIFTVSPIGVIASLYWSLAALALAFLLAHPAPASEAEPALAQNQYE